MEFYGEERATDIRDFVSEQVYGSENAISNQGRSPTARLVW